MKHCIVIFFTLLFAFSCEAPEVEISTSTQDAEIALRAPTCHHFPPNIVRATRVNYDYEILMSNSDLVNHVYLIYDGTETFLGTDDQTGLTGSLPPVSPGDELIFKIEVFDVNGNFTGDIWQSGPGARNPDGGVHALIDRCPGNEYVVNFEDIHADGWGAGDEPNYVDAIFRLY